MALRLRLLRQPHGRSCLTCPRREAAPSYHAMAWSALISALLQAAIKFIDLRALGGQAIHLSYVAVLSARSCFCASVVVSQAQMAGFAEEITMLSKFRHPNLILLMGASHIDVWAIVAGCLLFRKGWGHYDAYRFLVYEFHAACASGIQ
eukprot:3132176-Amphidinium_carterae.1